MKNSLFLFSSALVAVAIMLTFAGCILTFPVTLQVEDLQSSESGINNMVVVEDLGVGFDAIYLDPEDMAKNSVRNRGVRPRVFEFETDPNPHHTIDIPRLGYEPPTRRNRVLGVASETNPRFEWIEEARLVFTARDFQNAYQTSFSASGGAPVAAFSASASYGEVKKTTDSKNNMYVYKDGIFRGHIMELDPYYKHQLTESFRNTVSKLSKDKPSDYRDFILNWGTHYSREVTIGARCSFRKTITKEEASSKFQDNQQFQAAMNVAMGAYEASIEGGTDRSGGQGSQDRTEKRDAKFISYGGSGAGTTSFADWSDAAVVNSTLIDVKLEPYLSLFNSTYFPDDSLISYKYNMLKSELARYDSMQTTIIDTSFADTTAFFKDELVKFLVEIPTLICKESKEWNDNKDNTEIWRSQYWGSLSVEVLDNNGRSAFPEYLFFDRDHGNKKGTDPPHNRGKEDALRLGVGDEPYDFRAQRIYSVSSSNIEYLSISVTGQLKEMQNWGSQEFPELKKKGSINSIYLSDIKGVGEGKSQTKKIEQTSNTNDDKLEFTLKVTRID